MTKALRSVAPAGGGEAGSREGPAASSPLGPPDDSVLGDIAHEMGNHLHKVYYWTDYLREQVGDRSEPESAAIDMLAGAVERLERFMRMILEYFAPARMCFNKVRALDLVDGLAVHLPGRKLVVEGREDVADVTVFADAGLLGHAIRTVFERIASTLVAETELHVRVSLRTFRQYRGVSLEFQSGTAAGAADLRSGIEMSVAEKFLQMHGAELIEEEGPPKTLAIFVPLYA